MIPSNFWKYVLLAMGIALVVVIILPKINVWVER